MFNSRTRIKRRLSKISSEMQRLSEELRVLAEQRIQIDSDAADAQIRSVVSDSPSVTAEHSSAKRTAEAFKRDFDVKTRRFADLELKQDELLDELMRQK